MSLDRALVDAALAALTDPNTGRPYALARGVRDVAVDGGVVSAEIVLGYPADEKADLIRTLTQNVSDVKDQNRAANIAAMLICTPEFQWR